MDTLFLRSRSLEIDANGNASDNAAGAVLMIDTMTAGASVDVTWIDAAGNDAGTVVGVLVGRKLHAGGTFAGFRLTNGVPGAVIGLYVGPAGADSDNYLATSVAIGAVTVTNEVEIKNAAGAALPVASLETLATALGDIGGVAVTDALTALLAAAARRGFLARNLGPDPVALGGALLAYADAAIVLQPGETWRETIAPGAVWKAICDAGKTATVNILGMT